MEFKLNKLSAPGKTLIFFFIAALLIGYVVAIMQAYDHTGFDVDKVILSYRGSENPDLMAFPKPYRELLQNTHAHALSVPVVYFLLCLIFLGTSASQRFKSTLIAVLFSGLFLEYAALWLLRYVGAGFVYLSFTASGLTSLIYIYMCFRSLYELKTRRY